MVNQQNLDRHRQADSLGDPMFNHSQSIQEHLLVSMGAKFSEQDINRFLQILDRAEKRKWKAITKEINRQSEALHGSRQQGAPHKNISPTYVAKQFYSSFGMPHLAHKYGILGSSLPYAVATRGWEDVANLEYLSEWDSKTFK